MADTSLPAPVRGGMRTFLLIWAGQLFSILGSGLSGFAVGVWIYQQTGQATPFALTVLFGSLPPLLVMPFAGSLADRWNRRLIMILADTGAALGTVAIAILLFMNNLQVWHIYIIVVFSSMASAFQEPAYMASITMLVPKKDFARANGMMQMGQAIGSIITPLLAGVLFVAIGLKGIILIDLATFFFAVTPLLIVRIPQPELKETAEEKRRRNVLSDLAIGWNFIRSRGGLLGLLLYYAMVNFLLNFSCVLMSPMILSAHSPAALGGVQTVTGAGMLAGGLLMSTWGGPKNRRIPAVIGFITLAVIGLAVAGLRASPVFPAVGFFIMMLFIPMASGASMAVWQSKVMPEVQGRVFSVRAMISRSMMPLAYLSAGPLADHVFEPLMREGGALANTFLGPLLGIGPGRGIGLMFVISGLAAALVSGLAYLTPRLRNIETELPDAVPG
ncbi:MAG: MFS transporter [Chloroflexi bacterium]|nr:MFS transporter [Chloroflexota bacterium]